MLVVVLVCAGDGVAAMALFELLLLPILKILVWALMNLRTGEKLNPPVPLLLDSCWGSEFALTFESDGESNKR